jgi:hypothetical protein
MGLDLYHFKANAAKRGKPFVIEFEKGWDALLARFSWCIAATYMEDKQFAHFARRELFATLTETSIKTDYKQILLPGSWNIGRLFKLRSEEDVGLPMLIACDDTGRIGLPTLYVEEAGHQGRAVARGFYDEFGPTQYVCALDQVRRIYELTDADERSEFKMRFLDAWSERQSFVFVWW